MKKFIPIIAATALLLTACESDADVASKNLSTAAEQFEIERRVVFLNGITDEYILEVYGRCSIEDDGGQLEVTCKQAEDEYVKHFLGLSDNVTYFAEQVEVADADEYRYRVIFKPESIIPAFDLEASVREEEGN